MPGGSKRNRRELAVAAMVSEPTIDLAAARSGVSPRTLKAWLKEADFAAAVKAARAEVLKGAVNMLLSASRKAVETLERNLDAAGAAVQVRAAQVILDQARAGVETADLSEQLDALRQDFERLSRQNERRGRWQATSPPAVNASAGVKPNVKPNSETNGHAETNGDGKHDDDLPPGPEPLFPDL